MKMEVGRKWLIGLEGGDVGWGWVLLIFMRFVEGFVFFCFVIVGVVVLVGEMFDFMLFFIFGFFIILVVLFFILGFCWIGVGFDFFFFGWFGLIFFKNWLILDMVLNKVFFVSLKFRWRIMLLELMLYCDKVLLRFFKVEYFFFMMLIMGVLW